MIARLLSLAGLYLGPDDRMFGPNDGNPDGHFEHIGFLQLDEGLLSHFGGSWERPPRLNPGWQNDVALTKFVSEAKALVDSFPVDSPWGWKEPRTTLLLEFWKSLIPNLRFVICVRNPIDVAGSLANRNGMAIEHGIYLWNRYMRDALQGTVGYPTVFMFYDDFFVNATPEIQRLVRFCGLPVPQDLTRLQDIISVDLRHYASADQELLLATTVATGNKILYLTLRALLRRDYSGADRDTILHGDMNEFLHLMDEYCNQERVAQLENALNVRQTQLSDMQFHVQEANHKIERLEQQLTHLQQHAERLQTFSDAVRQTLVYRFYKSWIKPLTHVRVKT